jgi:hypothetical protein
MKTSYQFPRLHTALARRQMRGDVLRFECVMRQPDRMCYRIYCANGAEQTIIGVIGARSGIERVWFS